MPKFTLATRHVYNWDLFSTVLTYFRHFGKLIDFTMVICGKRKHYWCLPKNGLTPRKLIKWRFTFSRSVNSELVLCSLAKQNDLLNCLTYFFVYVNYLVYYNICLATQQLQRLGFYNYNIYFTIYHKNQRIFCLQDIISK